MRKLLSTLVGIVELRDVCTFGGLGLVGYGLYAVYPPLAFIVVGAALFWIGAH